MTGDDTIVVDFWGLRKPLLAQFFLFNFFFNVLIRLWFMKCREIYVYEYNRYLPE